jgi:hypothetical protein
LPSLLHRQSVEDLPVATAWAATSCSRLVNFCHASLQNSSRGWRESLASSRNAAPYNTTNFHLGHYLEVGLTVVNIVAELGEHTQCLRLYTLGVCDWRTSSVTLPRRPSQHGTYRQQIQLTSQTSSWCDDDLGSQVEQRGELCHLQQKQTFSILLISLWDGRGGGVAEGTGNKAPLLQ